jgi:cytochrome c-type biogenesis protein CcsB
MAYWEEIFVWLAVGFYTLSLMLFVFSLVFKKERFKKPAAVVMALAFGFQTVAIIARWYATGHIPVMHTYENSLVGSWSIILTYFVIRFIFPPAQTFAVAVTPMALLILGNGIMTGGELQPLEPAFRSNWLYIHILVSWFGFSSYVTASAAGLLYLIRAKSEKGFIGRLPDLKLLEELSLRLILFGLFCHAMGIMSGAIWAHSLWGRYWGWDPLETWSLISWLIYGLNLHMRITLGWTGRRAAWLAIVSLLGVIFSFFGFGHGSSIHTSMF